MSHRLRAVLVVLWASMIMLVPAKALEIEASPTEYLQTVYRYLQDHRTELQNDTAQAAQFAERYVLARIDFNQLARKLVGSSVLAQAPPEQLQELDAALRQQLLRYVFELIPKIEKQQLAIVEENDSLLGFNIINQFIPSISAQLELQDGASGDWRITDFQVAGIAYSKLKRTQYAVILNTQGLSGLIDYIENKNRLFFDELANGG